MKRICRIFMLCVLMLLVISIVGCMKPVNVPEHISIDTNETAFVIPLEGDTDKQVKFDSVELVQEYKVATKRILVPKRWLQTGRLEHEGEWIPTVRVIKVNRTPVTREWTKDDQTGSTPDDDAIWIESADSVSFSTGFTVTASIPEPETARFLYHYSGNSLATAMDTEVRARVQMAAAEFAGRFDMDELRSQKSDFIKYVRGEVVPYFGEKGIVISTIGIYGGFTYQNAAIQDAIDNVFVAQQEKAVAKAKLDAQKDINNRVREEGQGLADRTREVAKGEADAMLTAAAAEAKAIQMIAEATQQASQNPLFLEMKKLEVKSQLIEKWNGQFPTTMLTSGSHPSFLMDIVEDK